LYLLSKIWTLFKKAAIEGGDSRVLQLTRYWMPRLAKFGVCLFFVLFWLDPTSQAQEPQPPEIERIDIRGNRRIPEDTIRFYIQSRPGEPYNETRLEFDLRALYRANFFENIEIQERDGDTGKIITFILKEKPLIRSIEYSGNKSFQESDIMEELKNQKVGFTVDSRYDPSKRRAAERVLKELMIQNGKPLGTVYSEIEDIPPSSVSIRFVMDEGPKVRIGQIQFVGNKVFSDGDLKRALELNKERGPITMFKGTDKFHREKLDYDIELNLKAFYKERGYMMVQVGQPLIRIFEGPRGYIPMFRKTRQQFLVEIPIDAGDQFRLEKLELKNCGIFKCEALRTGYFGLKEGDIVNFKKITDALEAIEKLYGNFELSLEFKLTPGANSGIKYFVFPKQPNQPGSAIGLEYQVLDDERHPDAKAGVQGNRTASSLYDLIPADNKVVKPIGQWNSASIVVNGSQVQHWLNGVKVVQFNRHCQTFLALLQKSKYAKYENFGQIKEGHILLQDHGNLVSYRNIKIREF